MVYSNNFGQTRVGVRIVTQVVNAVDADATAFIAAAGITDLTQAAAISTLVDDLKTYGIWSKMKALYPFVGGSATSHKFNLKDPRDLDAAYRLVFNGGWVHSSTGAKPNGTTGYADTKLIPSANYPTVWDISIGFYSRTNIKDTITPSTDISAYQNNSQCIGFQTRYTDDKIYSQLYRDAQPYNIVVTNTDSSGLFTLSRTSTGSLKQFRNSTILGTSTATIAGSIPTTAICLSNGGNNTSYSSREQAFAFIGNGLSDTEATNFYTSVQKFNTTLGRQVGTPYVSDSDAQSFLNAAGITDLTQTSAINTLVTDLKAAGIWTKMKAIYPFVGGSAASHKWNLKDPRDLNAAYRLVFNGGWVHSSTGAKPNGTTGYANTFYNPSNNSTPFLGYYSITNGNTGTDQIDMGASDMDKWTWISAWYKAGIYNNILARNSNGSVLLNGGIQTDSRGWYWTNKVSTTAKLGKYGNILTSATDSTIAASTNIAIGAMGSPSGANYYSNRETAFSVIAEGLSDTDTSNLYTLIQKYQTTLGRQVDVPLVSDSDAQAFLTAAGITSYTQANAVNTLVVDLKAAGVWTKMKALYPFVGGSATSHKFNLKDPRDVDAAYRLVFSGGWTHTSTGALPNGTTGYADTKLLPNSALLTTSFHLSFYSRTISNASTTTYPTEIGSYNSSTQQIGLFLYRPTNSISKWGSEGYSQTAEGTTTMDSRYFGLASRTNSSTIKHYKNGSILATNTNVDSGNRPNISITIGKSNGLTNYSDRETAFASIGDGLTDSESSAFYTAVQKFQTSLGRQIGTPVYNTNGLVLNLDAGNANSYPGTGTTWFDLASSNNGTLVNGPTYDTSNGGGLILNGSNQYISSFNNTNLNFTSSDKFTISCFFKATSTSSYLGLVVSGNTSGEWNYGIWVTNGKLQVGTHNNNRVGNSTIVTGQIYQATLTYSNNTMKVYLNGLNDGTFTSISLFNGLNQQLSIGRKGSNPEWYFPGTVYNVQIYNRELSETEVLQNFNNTRGRFGL